MKQLAKILRLIMAAALLYMPLAAADALADICNGQNGGVPCSNSVGLRGTCVNNLPPLVAGGTCKVNANPDGTCISDSEYKIEPVQSGKGIVSTIITDLQNTLKPIAKSMFTGITQDVGFQHAVSAAITLYLMVYAILFMFGMVQVTVYDFFMRFVKIGIVGTLLNGTAWGYFAQTFIVFFNNGTDDIINHVSSIAVGGTQVGGKPFDAMDQAIVEAVSTKMIIILMATATTGPYGAIVVILLGTALWSFLKAILNAMWVYIMALIMRTLLFGLAPIFFACIMFSRTRQLFDGWLNQVLNSCLQPIFLFTFFSFFIQLIKAALDQLLTLDVCWTRWGVVQGAAVAAHYWRFTVKNCNTGELMPFDGIWGFNGPENTGCTGQPVNPVGIMLPLTLWIIADLAKRFNQTVVQIAKDIANVTTDFTYQGTGIGGGGAGAGGGSGSTSSSSNSTAKSNNNNNNKETNIPPLTGNRPLPRA